MAGVETCGTPFRDDDASVSRQLIPAVGDERDRGAVEYFVPFAPDVVFGDVNRPISLKGGGEEFGCGEAQPVVGFQPGDGC